MSETKKAAAKAAGAPQDAAAPKYEIAKLRAKSAKVLDVPPSTFDGAFHGRTGTYTVEEAKTIIRDWLSQPASL